MLNPRFCNHLYISSFLLVMHILLNPDEIILGIDLGTTNSCAYYIDSSHEEPLPVTYDSGPQNILPSCVQYTEDAVIVGEPAKRLIGRRGRFVVKNSKRMIGMRMDDKEVSAFKNNCGCVISEVEEKPVFVVSNEGKRKTPCDVGSDILKKIKERAELITEKHIKEIMITFPAHFDNNQRTATLLAAMKAGFDRRCIHMMNEPTAAAYCYGLDRDNTQQNILVYDLGGGTFDVSILRIDHGSYSVLAYAGNNTLGGSDFDQAIAADFEKCYKETFNESCFDDDITDEMKERLRRRIIQEAENVKILLKNLDSVGVNICFERVQYDDDDDDNDFQYTLEKMNRVLDPFITKTIETVTRALCIANLKREDISQIVLIGGSSRLKIVRQKLLEFFGRDIISAEMHPDESVAKGACLALANEFKASERITYSLGQLVSYNGLKVQCIIPKKSIIPTEHQLVTATSEDYCTRIKCAVCQGNSETRNELEDAANCVSLEPYYITDITLAPKGSIHILTRYFLDASGLVHVTEKEMETNRVLVDDMIVMWKDPVV